MQHQSLKEKIQSGAPLHIALTGNPNSGKSTLFNALTGLHQKTGNFPGVTVDKKTGSFRYENPHTAKEQLFHVIDLPGTYSLYPKSIDEQVCFDVLFGKENSDFPDIIIAVIDASNIKRNLLLATQLLDLGRPMVLAFNMIDVAEKNGISIELEKIKNRFGVPVVAIDSRHREGIDALKKSLFDARPASDYFIRMNDYLDGDYIKSVHLFNQQSSEYASFLKQVNISDREQTKMFNAKLFKKFEGEDTLLRFAKIKKTIHETYAYSGTRKDVKITDKIDDITTHPLWGFVVFLAVLFIIFQSIFYLAEFPMSWIEAGFVWVGQYLSATMPPGSLNDLLVNGIIAGLSGVAVFIPQIALLFGFIAILEDSGYMARVSFIMDKLMRKVGLNGRSVIPLISGVACAVPAIMSTRTISNIKERIVTIMITPLMSCSARLPVYTLLISLIVPDEENGSFFNTKGLMLMVLYLIGFIAAIGAALIFKFLLKAREKSYFIMELPIYRLPQLKTVFITMFDKVKVFLLDAGKIIVAISVILWFLSTHGPGDNFDRINEKYAHVNSSSIEQDRMMNAEKLEVSYAGILGKAIEPLIAPLGFDWKIGISLITSFAAREVFVGTMATIYSAGDEENTSSIRKKMQDDRNALTGQKTYSVAVCWSLLIFYAFAMQCVSTLAVVRRETKSWKWPLIQLAYMSILAYLGSFVVYQLLN